MAEPILLPTKSASFRKLSFRISNFHEKVHIGMMANAPDKLSFFHSYRHSMNGYKATVLLANLWRSTIPLVHPHHKKKTI